MTLRILVADDHALFRDGLAALLQTRGYKVVAEARDGLEALEQARNTHPDLILMDVNMPRLDGLAATRLILTELPETRIIILTVSDDDENLFEAIKSGAQGYLLKNTDTQVLFERLEDAARGEPAISGPIARKILKEFARRLSGGTGAEEPAEDLNEREKQVLSLASEGLTNRDIATRLNLSENTIKYHFKNILQKLHLRNRAQAVAYALQTGLLKTKMDG